MEGIHKKKMTQDEVDKRGIDSWGVWEKEPSEFDWEYTSEEHCYVIEGKAVVSSGAESVTIEEGDYVVFPAGLKCRWRVERPLKKYYEFR
ncbi:MAG: cupin domain-containing protein [Spirochaetes bacterium]|nr:cupin domain-containing protein [Spirochaetota bacterium]